MMRPAAYARQSEIRAAISQVEASLAPDVVRIRYEISQDWSGEWEILFRIVLTDEAASNRLREMIPKVERGLARILDFDSLGVFPHHNYRSISEQEKFREPAWA
jgi:hypothetical protein